MRRLTAIVLALAIGAACGAPRPEVVSTALEVSAGKADATVVVRNRGAGEGQIALKVTLRDASGKIVAREARTVELGERETIEVTVELTVPKDAGALTVEAEAIYPPD